MNDEKQMQDALANFFGKMGVDGVEFADENGNVKSSFKTKKPAIPTEALKGYGDDVLVGDEVVIASYENGRWTVDFDGRPVKILNYGLFRRDPFMLVDDEGKKVSLNYVGAGWMRSFKVVRHEKQ